MQDPKYSVVIPAFNVESYIGECIESVLAQGRDDMEIVVVDDGSTDSTRRIIERYFHNQILIRLIHQENKGLLAARRAGYAGACGKYILSVDGDDGLLQGAIDAIDVAVRECEPDCVTFGFTRKFGALKTQRVPKIPTILRPSREDMVALLVSTRQLNNIWSKCVRRECIGVDIDFSRFGRFQNGEDLLQVLTIIERAKTFARIDAPLYFYRKNASSITRTFRESDFSATAIVRGELHAFIAKEGLSGDAERAAYAVDYMQEIDIAQSLCLSTTPPARAHELLDEVVDSDFYRKAVEYTGSVRNLRFDYRPLAPLLTGRHYGAFYLAARLRSVVTSLCHALKRDTIRDTDS